MSEIAKNMSDETKAKLSKARKGKKPMLGHKHSAETKRKMSKAHQNMSDEAKLDMSLATMKFDPDYQYCEVWKDPEYIKDIRKDYCENVDCKKDYKRLCNHHTRLDKKRCAPWDIMTLCNSCHGILHQKLQRGSKKSSADPKDFIIINRPDHVSYIHKKSREIIKIRKLK